MKKIATATAVAALLFTAGCSSSDGSSDAPAASATSTASTPATQTTSTRTTSAAPARTTTATRTTTTAPPTLDFDIEGDPCKGVSEVTVDGKHYTCGPDGNFHAD